MTPLYKNDGTILIWGTVTQEPKLYTSKSGKTYTLFSVKYGRRHNEDGHMVTDFMNVTMWGDNATFVGDDEIGLAKGDTVLVCGYLVEDTYRKEGEDPDIQKWKVNADVVLDMTSIFQVAGMVVGGGVPHDEEEPPPPKVAKPKFTETTEKTPFQEEIEDSDGELPF